MAYHLRLSSQPIHHQTPNVNYLNRFKILKIPCRVNAEILLCRVVTVLIEINKVRSVWLVEGLRGRDFGLRIQGSEILSVKVERVGSRKGEA